MMSNSNTHEPSTSTSLLQRVQGGEDAGWRLLTQVYGPIVYGWARRSGCQSADAADVMQETFVAVSRTIGKFDRDRAEASFRGWLWTICRNKIRDLARRRSIRAEAGDLAAGGTAAQLAMAQLPLPASAVDSMCEKTVEGTLGKSPPTGADEDSAWVRRRMIEFLRPSFDERTWWMFWETAVIGRSPDTVADEAGVSRWAVYKARARVLHRLRRDLEGLS
ncbi:RNA polymerase sigma factor [Allorhodopirellula heiligendammensis]|uniref:RNA polymerase sigma factor CnrH n=1 Tax=Allorhodopirellula heiligendammensis TaxID=2714739 RepID=A0A5C6BXU8_9BACT|nr:sigma-70 family RNA polymerase sigma factor [Allorhodopirellula heiligendammensis]TWU16076.1 RNA polymerase sigma factor CnrH [Allorhodopirellula heiligendammensis]